MSDFLTDWEDWNNVDKKTLPIIIFGGPSASHNQIFDTRNNWVKLIDYYDIPPVFKVRSMDDKLEIDRCFPLSYRLATEREVELLTNPNSNI